MRRLVNQTLAPRSPAAQTRHVGLGPRLVDEDQTPCINFAGERSPVVAALDDIRAVLFRGVDRLFLKVRPNSFNASQIAETEHTVPN